MQRLVSFLFAAVCLPFGLYTTYDSYFAGRMLSPLDEPLTPPILIAVFAVGLSHAWYFCQPRSDAARHTAVIITALVLFSAAAFVLYLGASVFRALLLAALGLYVIWYNFIRKP